MERFFPLRAERVVLADVLETFPFPIAHTYRQLQEEMDRQEPVPAAWQLKDAYECAIKFAAALAVADALENGPSPDLSSELVSRLLKPLSIGDWQGLLEASLKPLEPFAREERWGKSGRLLPDLFSVFYDVRGRLRPNTTLLDSARAEGLDLVGGDEPEDQVLEQPEQDGAMDRRQARSRP